MRFGILGPLAVWTTNGAPVRVPELKVRAVLADLLLQDGRAIAADRLSADLWGDRLPGNPSNTLQTKVSQLRRALEKAEPGSGALVVRQAPGYRLDVGPAAVDVTRFRALTSRARDTENPRARAALLTDALALWRGPTLADFADEPFAAAAIARLDEERLDTREELAQARLDLGEHSALLGELGDLVERYPLRERLRGMQMRALYGAGRQIEALDGYRELRRRLADELGLEPGPGLSALHQAILERDPALLGSAHLRTALPESNLPARLGELVGRSAAVQSVRSQVCEARLVTLTGPGGVGKTRLAVEAARRFVDVGDGVRLVELAGIDRHACPESSCPAQEWVAAAVASVLGVRDDSPAGPLPSATPELVDRLADALRGREIVLVLDNCEQLVEQVAELAARLLRGASGLRILATSQEPLGLAGEVLWSVPPLEVPGTAHLKPGRTAGDVLARVRELSAVRLFVARAAAAAPGFALDEGNVAAVAAICRRLDGIPLALELAATKVRALGVHELLGRLDDRFALLATGHRQVPARHRTLRAMIDWSWELLTGAEQAVLRRLAIPADGCSLDAAEALCAGDGVRPGEVVDLLARLVDRSLVVGPTDTGAGPRYRLLESVSAYCLEKVGDAGELDRMRLRHARYYVALAERAEPFLRGPQQRQWLERLDREGGNLRDALDTATRRGDGELALRLVNAMTWYWFLRGRLGEARRAGRLALSVRSDPSTMAWQTGLAILGGDRADVADFDSTRDIDDPAARARARWFLGYVTSSLGDMPAGEDLTKRALAELATLGDRWGIAACLSDRVTQRLARGDFRGARHDAARSAALFGELGDRWGQLQASFALGTLAEISGEYEQAARLHRSGLAMAEQLGLWAEVSYQLSWLGRIALLTGDHAQGRELHERAMRLAADHGFKPGEMYAETGLALGERRAGRFEVAEKHLRVVLEWHRRSGFEQGSTLVLAELGFIAEQRGDAESARRLHLEGFALASRVGDPRAMALAMEGLAGAFAIAGDHERAARLLGAAKQARGSVGMPMPAAERGDVDRITDIALGALGEHVFAAEFTRGGALRPAELARS